MEDFERWLDTDLEDDTPHSLLLCVSFLDSVICQSNDLSEMSQKEESLKKEMKPCI